MISAARPPFVLSLLLLAAPAHAQSDARDLTRQFELAPGLEVRLWAESPQLYNPTAMDVDARGRIWVTEAVNYRQWAGRNPGKHFDAGDRVVILEDTDGDGVCDSSKVFVQEKDLVAPLGICVQGNKVIVSCSPNAIVYTDENGDDVPDKREVLLTGFGGHDHDHGLHSFVAGPDGEWYFNCGNAGPHIVTDKRGFTLRSGSIYRDGGATLSDNRPNLKSDDERVYTGGLVLRVSPAGDRLRVLAHNFRNNYEVALDSFGNLFQTDNDDDGNQCCRTTWVMEGGNYGYFSEDGSRYWSADRRPGQDTPTAHWHQEDPGVMPTSCVHGAGGPTGLCVYEGGLLPKENVGLVLDADAGRNCVYAHRPVARGAGYDLQHGSFLAARVDPKDERSRWFRPSDVLVGAEGAIYVADWYDPGVGGHAAGDKEAYGRILRIAPKGDHTRAPKIDVSTPAGAAAALRSPAPSVRALGFTALKQTGASAQDALQPLLTSGEPRLVARALWMLGSLGDAARKQLLEYTKDPNPELRLTAVRVWRHAYETLRIDEARTPPALYSAEASTELTEQSPAVLRELARCMHWNFDATGRWRAFSGLDPRKILDRWDGSDPWLLETLVDAFNGLPELFISQRGTAEKDPLAWSERTAKLAWRVHLPELVPDLLARGLSPKLGAAQRKQAVESLAFHKEREAAEALLTLALGGPEDVRALARWWVEQRSTNDWAAYELGGQLGAKSLEKPELAWSSGLVKQGLADVALDLRGVEQIELVVEPGPGGNGCDWSDWIAPRLVSPAGERPLAKLAWQSAEAGWGSVNVGKNCNGGPLAVGGEQFTDGIGTHAKSRIVYALPEGTTRLLARAGPDKHGTDQGCGDGVEFQVWTVRARDRSREKALVEALALGKADDAELSKAAEELSTTREGGLALVRLASDGKLSPRGRAAAEKHVFHNPDVAVRALASQFYKPPAAAKPLPSNFELLRMAGDAHDGEQVFFGEKARCSSCHRFFGRGGDIGPDLSGINTKYARKEILDAILNPSAAIAFGYEAWMFETSDGELVSGFLVSDGPEVVIKDTSGQRRVLHASEIASRTKQKVSTMPDNIGLGLEPQELADVLEFISTNPRVPGRRTSESELFDGKDLEGWTFFSEDKHARAEDVFSVVDGTLSCKGQPIGYLRTERDYTNFVLTLEWRFDPAKPPGNSGVLLRMNGPDKVWPRSIEAQLEHRNAGDIWNIDNVPMQVDSLRTDGRRTTKLLPSNEKPLGEWNRYEISLDGGELRLYVNGELQNSASWCEVRPGKICLQSEGAAIQFRNLRITPIER